MQLNHLIHHFKNKINYLSTMWRAHSCVPRRDSSRRSLVIYTNSEVSVETSLCQYRGILYILYRAHHIHFCSFFCADVGSP